MYIFRKAKGERDYHDLFKLRYRVYCLEKKWLDKNNYPDQKERDTYDSYSTHFIAQGVNGQIVATSRLIEYWRTVEGLPIQKHPKLSNWFSEKKMCAEMSRFAIDYNIKELDVKPWVMGKKITLGLTHAIYHYSKSIGIEEIYIVAEIPFMSLMNSWGFCFKTIAEPDFYMGDICIPAILNIEECEKHMQIKKPSLYQWFQKEITN